ncbi:GNAT family N-acetyltransferase [Methanocella sp. MCL-LM]|uniref:GNAT family N-acetyltransferase n=1 Tax=Methanocella sp. MCL-LM TaxID=3412035 RepID=UPI003C754998
MTVALIDNKNVWDDFIDASPQGQLFHKWDALKIIEKHTGYKLYNYAVYKGNAIIGVFPVFYRNINGIKAIFSPPPNTCVPYMGFAMCTEYMGLKQKRKEHYLSSVVDEVNAEINKLGPNFISANIIPGFIDVRPFKWNHYAGDLNFTFVIDLERSLEDILASFDSTCKKNIKKMEKLGLPIEPTTDAETFFDIMNRRYNEQGIKMPMISARYLHDIREAFPDNIKLYFLYNEGRVSGLNGNIEFKDKVTLWLGNANMHMDFAANDYLVWQFIKSAKERGFRQLEIQGAGEKRLSEFKSKFSPNLELCHYIYKKDNLGKLAEVAYANIIRKKWV